MNAIPEFGVKRENEERRDGGCGVVFDPETSRFAVAHRPLDGLMLLFSGGVEADEDLTDGILREVREESGLHDFSRIETIAQALTHYHNKAKNVNRVAHATCLLIVLGSTALIPTKLEEHEKFSLMWVASDDIFKNWEERNQGNDYDHWIYFLRKGVTRLNELGYTESGGNLSIPV